MPTLARMQPVDLSPTERDPVSGYASPDLLDTAPNEQAPTPDEVRDPMSGYTSADALEPGEAR